MAEAARGLSSAFGGSRQHRFQRLPRFVEELIQVQRAGFRRRQRFPLIVGGGLHLLASRAIQPRQIDPSTHRRGEALRGAGPEGHDLPTSVSHRWAVRPAVHLEQLREDPHRPHQPTGRSQSATIAGARRRQSDASGQSEAGPSQCLGAGHHGAQAVQGRNRRPGSHASPGRCCARATTTGSWRRMPDIRAAEIALSGPRLCLRRGVRRRARAVAGGRCARLDPHAFCHLAFSTSQCWEPGSRYPSGPAVFPDRTNRPDTWTLQTAPPSPLLLFA